MTRSGPRIAVATSMALLACKAAPSPSETAECSGADCAGDCVEGSVTCRAGGRAAECREGRWVERDCDYACRDGVCVECEDGERHCTGDHSAEVCTGGHFVAVSCGDEACADGACQCPVPPYRCTDQGRERCGEGVVWVADACPAEMPICRGGDCLRCELGSSVCLTESAAKVCSENGKSEGAVACPNGCDAVSGRCFEPCSAGALRCRGALAVERCRDDGSRYVPYATCDEDAGETCSEGECRKSCDLAAQTLAPSGCSFHAPPVPFIDQGLQFQPGDGGSGTPTSIHVLNPDGASAARVRVVQAGRELAAFVVPPFEFRTAYVYPFAVSPIESTRMRDAVIGVESNRAVFVVHHLDVLQEGVVENSLSGDTAFLLPDHLLHEHGTRYRVLSQPTCVSHENVRPGGFSLSSLSSETARVHMTLTVATAAGPSDDPPVVPGGVATEIDLSAGEVVHYRTQCADPARCSGRDLTGSLIESVDGRPFAAFNGGVSRVPCSAGHVQNQLLEQLMPVSLWGGGPGDSYVASVRRTQSAEEEWAFVTDEPSNELVFDPPRTTLTGENPVLANPGSQLRFQSGDAYSSFVLHSAKPVLVGRYFYVGTDGSGTSTFTLERPVRFWRKQYDIASVGRGGNRLLIVLPEGARVQLDGGPISALDWSGPTGHRLFDLEVVEGAHRLSSDSSFGLLVYGHPLVGTRTGSYSYSGPVGFGDQL